MSRFDNKLCPVCRIPLNENSDVVVCPICGTPHHRACYLKYNRCGVESYHDSGFVWKGFLPDEQPTEEETEQQIQQENADINAENDDPHHAEYPGGTPGAYNSSEPSGAQPVDLDDILNQLKRQTMDETRGADGVSNRELSCFVGRSVMHYSQAFSVFRAPVIPGQKKRIIFFNLCSGLFAPIHQFYRRMDMVGLLLLLLEVIYYVPTLLSVTGVVSAGLINTIQLFTSGLNFIAMVGMCMFGDYLYYRFSVKRIKKIRMNYDDGKAEGYYQALTEKGSPSWLRAIIAILTVYLAEALILLYIAKFGPAAGTLI